MLKRTRTYLQPYMRVLDYLKSKKGLFFSGLLLFKCCGYLFLKWKVFRPS